jgi:predicted transcriptional regulator of viral defense system
VKHQDLLQLAGDFPVVESAALRTLGEDPKSIGVQLSRWVASGKLVQLRRGVYLLPEKLRRNRAPLETIANLLVAPSYVSLERGLSIHEMIPEAVPLVQSVTTGRPGRFVTPVATFEYRHVKTAWFFGYREMEIGQGRALVATPEKALLDLLYLSSGEMTTARLEQYRLQDLEKLDLVELAAMAGKAASPRLLRAVKRLQGLLVKAGAWETVSP